MTLTSHHVGLLRDQLVALLCAEEAHVSLDRAIEGFPPSRYGDRPDGAPHSAWELVEHMRRVQRDLLDFCVDPDYVPPEWPDDYWPDRPAPESPEEWVDSVASFREDRMALVRLIESDQINLLDLVPRGEGETFFREVLLAADHTAYHVGQLVLLRRLMGEWETGTET